MKALTFIVVADVFSFFGSGTHPFDNDDDLSSEADPYYYSDLELAPHSSVSGSLLSQYKYTKRITASDIRYYSDIWGRMPAGERTCFSSLVDIQLTNNEIAHRLVSRLLCADPVTRSTVALGLKSTWIASDVPDLERLFAMSVNTKDDSGSET